MDVRAAEKLEVKCFTCGYEPRGHGESGACPECGHSIEDSLAHARTFLGSPKSNPALMLRYQDVSRWLMGYGAGAFVIGLLHLLATGRGGVSSCTIVYLIFAFGVRHGSLFMLELCLLGMSVEALAVIVLIVGALTNPNVFTLSQPASSGSPWDLMISILIGLIQLVLCVVILWKMIQAWRMDREWAGMRRRRI